jgi:hypothetical protein
MSDTSEKPRREPRTLAGGCRPFLWRHGGVIATTRPLGKLLVYVATRFEGGAEARRPTK